MKEQDIPRVLQRVQAAKNEAERARGKLDTLKAQLVKEFGVGTASEARALLVELREKQAKAQEQLNAALEAFSRDYPELVRP